MTSVLYGAGLNYQLGNPVRQEIVAVRREVDALRKQLEHLTEENIIYRKYLMKLLQKDEKLVKQQEEYNITINKLQKEKALERHHILLKEYAYIFLFDSFMGYM